MNHSMPRPPSRAYYWLAGILSLVGLLGFVLIIFLGLGSLTDSFQRFQVPGRVALDLPKAKIYTIYHEYQSYLDGRSYTNTQGLPPLKVSVFSQKTGQGLPVKPATTKASYQLGSYEGKSLLQFKVPEAGIYVLNASYPDGTKEPVTVLSVGSGFGTRLTLLVLASIGTLFFCELGALTIFLVTFFKRRKILKPAPSHPVASKP